MFWHLSSNLVGLKEVVGFDDGIPDGCREGSEDLVGNPEGSEETDGFPVG
jgi:hypothetical protein